MNVQILRRRIIYIVAIVLLLFPIYLLGQPSVRSADGTKLSQGGALSKIRSKYELGQADLGAIDPAGESMRLATLGMRGVAVSILWQRAEYYKREQFWDNFSATLNQITKLEPHFVKVWDYLSWNMSYNISVEFDDYRQRYAWVKKGIDYLLTGTKYNRRKTDLPYQLGWNFGNKFGVSDEKVQFRQLYREDNDWHEDLIAKGMDVTQQEGLGPDNYPDSWLTGRLWYERAYAMVNEGSAPCKGPTNFYRMGPMWLINFADMIEKEGHLGYPAELAWRKGSEGWDWFGNLIMRSTFGEDLRMKDIAAANQAVARAKEEFEAFCGERLNELREQRRAELTDEERRILDTPDLERTSQEVFAALQIEGKLHVPYREVALQMPEDKQFKATELAMAVEQAEEFVRHVEIYRNQVNYAYWEMRCTAEQTDEALAARADLYEANQLLDKGILDGAIAKYDSAWKNWNAVFNRFPAMMTDESAEEVNKAVQRYRRLIDKELPSDFVLNDFLRFREEYDASNTDPRLTQVLAEWSTNPNRGAWFDVIRKTREEQEAANAAADAADPVAETREEQAAQQNQPPKAEPTQPEATKPDAEEQKANEPKADESKADEPKADKPEADKPEATESEATEPEATEPEATGAAADAATAAVAEEGAPPAP